MDLILVQGDGERKVRVRVGGRGRNDYPSRSRSLRGRVNLPNTEVQILSRRNWWGGFLPKRGKG